MLKIATALLSTTLLLSACGEEKTTFASNARLQGDEYKEIAKNWEKGTDMIEDGEAKVKKGKKQVKKGRSLIEDGEENQENGLSLVSKGQKLKAQAEANYSKRSKLVTE